MAKLLISLLIVSLSINGIISQNIFGYEMLQNLARESDNNVFFSPFSIETAIKMLMSGTRGKTQDRLRTLFYLTFAEGISDVPTIEESNKKTKENMETIQKNNANTTFTSANKLLVKKTFPLNKDYVDMIKDVYKGEITEANFSYPNISRMTNDWVSDATHGKIVKIVDDINPETLMIVLNAAYFKGKWKNPFPHDANNKLTANFTSNGFSKPISIDFMRANGDYKYFADDKLKMIELPLYDDFNFYVIMPMDAEESIDGLIDSINFNELKDSVTELKNSKMTNVDLWLPKFRLDNDYDLKDTLQTMGFGNMFDYDADFSGVNGQKNLKLSSIVHKASTDVNEEGAEAAAVTAAQVVPISATAPVSNPMAFKVDRPFAFFIQDQKTSQTIFMGRVNSLINEQQLGYSLL